MLLILALLLFVVFFGAGFAFHLLWLGLIIAVVIGLMHVLTGGD